MSEARFKGLEIELRRFSGARVLRVVHPAEQQIGEHRHDWAYIGLYTAGRYREQFDGGETDMWGPCAVLHPTARPHADLVHDRGLETLTIEFDPAWLRLHGFAGRLDSSRVWNTGNISLASRRLAAVLASPDGDERRLGTETALFLNAALVEPPAEPPRWIEPARRWVAEGYASATELARRLDLHPAYVCRTYRWATGEGIGETLRRRRVETASSLLRRTNLPLAEIAIDAGFCDQSHMNRCFIAVLGRTPRCVRHEQQLFELECSSRA
jgi:AraC family transcriptional regulator